MKNNKINCLIYLTVVKKATDAKMEKYKRKFIFIDMHIEGCHNYLNKKT